MTGTDENTRRSQTVREGIKDAGSAKPPGAETVDRLRKADPATTDAVEQEATDGPPNRGLSR